jgi:hypothetical protein
MRWTRGRHSWRWGGDLRVQRLNERTTGTARGAFTFTGFATAQGAAGAAGYDLADFLLGLPQRTAIQFSGRDAALRQTSWNAYAQDDWRVASRVTINAGVRYEFVPPYSEARGRLVNLDVAPGFAAVDAVIAGGTGRFTGAFPAALIESDRNNFAPRIGAAVRLREMTVLRGGYSINYDAPAYSSLAERLAQQPPFAVAQTGVATAASPLTLANGFPALAPTVVTNTFGVDRRLVAGVAQIWMTELQQEFTPTTTMTVTYTGTRGAHLAMLRAPGRVAGAGRTIDAQPFLWETSDGWSRMSAGGVRLRKTFRGGSSADGSYVYSRSSDNDPSLGGADVPQNDLDLDGERGPSNFDRRHKATASYTIALPVGHDRTWLHDGGATAAILGDWSISGDVQAASGLPFTARVRGDFTDVARTPFAALRANATGQPIALAHPTQQAFFNTGAFTAPAPGAFGNAGRNTIRGPGYWQMNMTFVKAFPRAAGRGLELRAQISNVFNTPQLIGLDTYVDSPTFGRVTSAGPMRRTIVSARYSF